MTSLTSRLAGLLLAGCILGHASAQIDTVTSSVDENGGDGIVSAAVGAVLTIDGANFGSAKPKAFLVDPVTSKKYVLKVTAFSDVQLTAEVKKGVAGDLVLNVQPKGATEAFTSDVTIEVPRVDELLDEAGMSNIDEASPGTVFQIAGGYLGGKKGKVRIGGKPAKVLEWFNDHVLLAMPKKLANGLWPIALDNKVAVNDEVEITMFGSTVKIGKATLHVFIEGAQQTFKYTPFAGVPQAGAIILYAVTGTNPAKAFTLIIPFDYENDSAPATITNEGVTIFNSLYVETGKVSLGQIPKLATWSAASGLGDMTVQINAASGGQVAGEFDLVMPLQNSTFQEPKPDPIHITGDFVIDV